MGVLQVTSLGIWGLWGRSGVTLWAPPGNIPPRLHPWGPAPAPFSLPFLEALLSHVGLNEVHKAIGLFLETLAAPGAPQTLHRYRQTPQNPPRFP